MKGGIFSSSTRSARLVILDVTMDVRRFWTRQSRYPSSPPVSASSSACGPIWYRILMSGSSRFHSSVITLILVSAKITQILRMDARNLGLVIAVAKKCQGNEGSKIQLDPFKMEITQNSTYQPYLVCLSLNFGNLNNMHIQYT